MLDFILLFTPGVITYLVAAKFAGRITDKWYAAIAEILAYTGIDAGIVWYVMYLRGISDVYIIDQDANYLAYNGVSFWLSLLLAFIAGIIIAILKKMNFSLEIIPVKEGFFNKLSRKTKRILKGILVLVVFIIAAVSIIQPKIENSRKAAVSSAFRETVTTLLTDINKEIASELDSGVSVDELSDLTIDKLTVKKVTADQHWNNVSPNGTQDAVYMVDGNGTLVYISYRDKNYCATWSGPSDDPLFIASHGGWSNGNGAGWTGTGLR